MSRDATMLTVKTPARQIAAVNFKFAHAIIAGGAAYLMWPDSAYWWGLYPISVLLGMVAFCLVIDALKLIVQIRRFERDQETFREQGSPVKKAALAQHDFLTRKGVIDHGK